MENLDPPTPSRDLILEQVNKGIPKVTSTWKTWIHPHHQGISS